MEYIKLAAAIISMVAGIIGIVIKVIPQKKDNKLYQICHTIACPKNCKSCDK